MLSTVTSVDGIDGPLAIERTAVWTIVRPSSTPMMWLRLAIAVLLWKCISRVASGADSRIRRIHLRARSGPSTPASSPRTIVAGTSLAAKPLITSA